MKYLVLKKRPSTRARNLFLEMAGAASLDDTSTLPFEAHTTEASACEAADLRRDPAIEDVIPSMPLTLITPVADVAASTPPEPAWGLKAIRATDSPYTGAGVTVAILDTGIEQTHPAFAAIPFSAQNLCDFTTDDAGIPGSAPDTHGHGTHVAGTVFGRPVNGERIGVALGVTRVLIGKVLGPNGGSTEAIYHAIEWALARRADVISMSLGIDYPGMVRRLVEADLPPDIAASRALEAYRANIRLFDRVAQLVQSTVALGRGAVLVAASGNESRRQQDARYTVAAAPPAAADGFLSVGAVGPNGDASSPYSIAPFSNTGCLLAAPGVGILSAALGGGLTPMNGTSMATPHVAGAIALWIEKLFPGGRRPPQWARDVQRSLESHVAPTPGLSRNDTGLGVVQSPV